jgi:hypothetical protein
VGHRISKLVVVLGMHRSGTSATTRGLKVLGVALGEDLVPAAIDNPKGFWEDREFVGINEELLQLLGAGSDRLGLLDWSLPENPAIFQLRSRAEEIVRARCDKCAIWGFKDPRTARLLQFWQPIFAKVGCDVHYVIVNRNPLSIVESLHERNNIDSSKAFYLWLEHLINAISKTTGAKRVVVAYDKLLHDAGEQLLRIARAIDLPAPDPLALAVFKNEFLDSGLRHTVFTAHDLHEYPTVPSQVIKAYDWLEKLANDDLLLDIFDIQRDFETLFQELIVSTAYWKSTLLDHLSAIKIREQLLRDRDEAIRAQAGLIDDRDETIRAQAALVDDGVAGMDAMEKMIHERDETIRAQAALIDDGMAGMRAMEKLIRERDAAIRTKELEAEKLYGNAFVRALRMMRLID